MIVARMKRTNLKSCLDQQLDFVGPHDRHEGSFVGDCRTGDDTIFIAAKDATAQPRLVRESKKLTAAPVR
jgi:hypothetical protein